ncbi:MAG: hypothetical protein Q8L68_05145 [Methylococcales bacterium]|nr:hypothetical protein [Methylococcales bacterium]
MSVYLAGINRAVDTGDTYFIEIAKLPISGSKMAKDKLSERPQINKKPIYDGKPLEARIEFARYIVDCPNCRSAEFAFEDDLFLCSNCGNSDINGQIRKVKMPTKRKQIEDILGKRKIINRHWYPSETIEKLQEENNKGVM